MADYLIKEETLTAIADSIRDNTDTVAVVCPEEMPNQINEVYNKGYADGSSQSSAELPTPTLNINTDTGLVTTTVSNSNQTKSNTLQINTKAATTITPGTSNKTAVNKGYYTTGAITVAGDSDLKAANIKQGVNIFGVTGTHGAPVGGYLIEDGPSNMAWPWPDYNINSRYDVWKIGDVVFGYIAYWEHNKVLISNKELYYGELSSSLRPSAECFTYPGSDKNPFCYDYTIGNNFMVIGNGFIFDEDNDVFGVELRLKPDNKLYFMIVDRNNKHSSSGLTMKSNNSCYMSICYPLKIMPTPSD